MIDLRHMTAAAVRAALGLLAHPEGGSYRETWRDVPADGSRGSATSILFLLTAGERSAPHRVDAAEIWLWHGGGALELRVGPPDGAAGGETACHVLGPDLAAGQVLQAVVPAGAWQEAAPLGGDDWVLVGCVVAPAFRFEGFELRSETAASAPRGG